MPRRVPRKPRPKKTNVPKGYDSTWEYNIHQTILQEMENLEQLNWASNGIEMHSRLANWNVGINSPEDLKRVGGIIQ